MANKNNITLDQFISKKKLTPSELQYKEFKEGKRSAFDKDVLFPLLKVDEDTKTPGHYYYESAFYSLLNEDPCEKWDDTKKECHESYYNIITSIKQIFDNTNTFDEAYNKLIEYGSNKFNKIKDGKLIAGNTIKTLLNLNHEYGSYTVKPKSIRDLANKMDKTFEYMNYNKDQKLRKNYSLSYFLDDNDQLIINNKSIPYSNKEFKKEYADYVGIQNKIQNQKKNIKKEKTIKNAFYNQYLKEHQKASGLNKNKLLSIKSKSKDSSLSAFGFLYSRTKQGIIGSPKQIYIYSDSLYPNYHEILYDSMENLANILHIHPSKLGSRTKSYNLVIDPNKNRKNNKTSFYDYYQIQLAYPEIDGDFGQAYGMFLNDRIKNQIQNPNDFQKPLSKSFINEFNLLQNKITNGKFCKGIKDKYDPNEENIAKPDECFARAFETYLSSKNANPFLAVDVHADFNTFKEVYPQNSEEKDIISTFDNLIKMNEL